MAPRCGQGRPKGTPGDRKITPKADLWAIKGTGGTPKCSGGTPVHEISQKNSQNDRKYAPRRGSGLIHKKSNVYDMGSGPDS